MKCEGVIKNVCFFPFAEPTEEEVESAKEMNLSTMAKRLMELQEDAYYRIKINHRVCWYDPDWRPSMIANERMPALISRIYVYRYRDEEER